MGPSGTGLRVVGVGRRLHGLRQRRLSSAVRLQPRRLRMPAAVLDASPLLGRVLSRRARRRRSRLRKLAFIVGVAYAMVLVPWVGVVISHLGYTQRACCVLIWTMGMKR